MSNPGYAYTLRGFERFCKQIGFELEPFQRKIARAAFAPERELVVLVPRGNGKTTLMAVLAVHHIVSIERPAVYVAASSREQARILYEAAREFASRGSLAEQIIQRHLELRVPGGHLRVLAADALKVHGLTPSLAIIDELHAHADDRLWVALRSASIKRAGSRIVVISTAPETAETPLGRLRARALASPKVQRRGALTEASGGSVRLLEWAVADDADVDDPRTVKQANPASWITVDGLREQREALPDLAFRRFHANQIAGRQGAWLPPGAWQTCAGETSFEHGERVWVAVDLSGGGGRSDTAVVWVNERLHVGCEVWSGEHDATAEVMAFVSELATEYQIVELVLDFWSRMIPASERLYRAVTERRLIHPDDARLNAHVHNAVAKQSRRGWRIDRPSTGADHVDGVVALAMAVERAEHKPEPVRLLGWL